MFDVEVPERLTITEDGGTAQETKELFETFRKTLGENKPKKGKGKKGGKKKKKK